MLLFRIHTGREVLKSIEEQAQLRGIANAAVVSLIGAVDTAVISYMDRHHNDIHVTLNNPLELSGTGEITDGAVHIHCTVSSEEEGILHGHLHHAVVGPFHVNAYIQQM